MNLQLDDIALFVRIADLGTLSAAARERNVPVSQVSRALRRLEQGSGVQLLHRSTHGLSLTDEGDTLLAYGRRLLETSAELDGALSGKRSGPAGWVRVSVSPLLAETVIVPSLNGLYQRHPDLRIDIAADDRIADMAREGIDIALRTGSPSSDTMVAREIGSYRRALYAAPSYLAQWGVPLHPGDLRPQHLIANSVAPHLNRWPYRLEGTSDCVHHLLAAGHTRTDNTAVQLRLVLQGVGIGRLMDLVVRPLLAQGALVPVLPHYFDSPRVPIYAVMLQERNRLPKIRACIAYWQAWLAGAS